MKLKKVLPFVATMVITLLAAFVIITFLLRPRTLEIASVDLELMADGEYIGICQNKIMLAVVKVEVITHEITSIEILEHKASYMEQARQIAADVCSGQSLDVDVISGATLTSNTVLKAIENALEQAVK